MVTKGCILRPFGRRAERKELVPRHVLVLFAAKMGELVFVELAEAAKLKPPRSRDRDRHAVTVDCAAPAALVADTFAHLGAAA